MKPASQDLHLTGHAGLFLKWSDQAFHLLTGWSAVHWNLQSQGDVHILLILVLLFNARDQTLLKIERRSYG